MAELNTGDRIWDLFEKISEIDTKVSSMQAKIDELQEMARAGKRIAWIVLSLAAPVGGVTGKLMQVIDPPQASAQHQISVAGSNEPDSSDDQSDQTLDP